MQVAPLVSRWMERLLAGLPQPLTLAQYLVLRAAGEGAVLAAELARAAGVSLASASEHATVLRNAGLITSRREGRRVSHTITWLGQQLLAGG